MSLRAVPLNRRVANGSVRERVRQRALQRVRERRADLIARLRSGEHVDAGEEAAGASTVEDESVRALLQREYVQACRELADPAVGALSADEYVELALLLECDGDVVADDEWAQLIAAATVFEDAALLAAADSAANDDLDGAVVCPVCRVRALHTAHGSLLCECGLRVDTGAPLDLEHVRRLLADSLLGHAQCCDATPRFVVVDRFGLQALYLDCAHCAALVLIL